jgi:archaellum biogenesis protein FlaJ (TadC family)
MSENKYHTSIEEALEEAAYRCDMEVFRSFIERVEAALLAGDDTRELEKEIRNASATKKSGVFNIHKIANDATTNLQDQQVV